MVCDCFLKKKKKEFIFTCEEVFDFYKIYRETVSVVYLGIITSIGIKSIYLMDVI